MNCANFFACMSMLAHGGYVTRTLPSLNAWVSIAHTKISVRKMFFDQTKY